MKMYVYTQATSPCRELLIEGTFPLGVMLSDETCQSVGMTAVDVGERPNGLVRPVATKVNGVWTGGWEPFTFEGVADEVTATRVRFMRSERLKASDWTQAPDAPVDKQAWALYRQALRDVTTQPGFPHDVVWPNQP